MLTLIAKPGRWLGATAAALLSLALVACGGGGGSAGTPIVGGGGGGGGTTPTAAATVTVTLSSTTVTSATPATVSVLVKNKAGAALPGLVVTFDTTLGLGSFSAPSALTDDTGKASVQLSPKSGTSTGADTVVARVKYNDIEFTGSTGFQMTATNVTISSFTSDTSTLSAYGQTTLTVQLAGTTPGAPVGIVATSSCVANGKATLTPSNVSTTTGRAVFTYRDSGCGAVAATDAVQVSVTGTALTSSVTLTLASPAATSISFVSASPDTIYLKGSGYVENSNIKFKVNDANGNGVPERLVELEPTTLAGGLLIDGGSGKVTKKTDANGEVIVRVNSGTVPTPVRIKATLSGSTISTVSSNLSIAVGLPSQLNFSLSAETLNIEGYNIDGIENTFGLIASDRMGNPVPDGTAINFITESGQVQASRQTALVNGLARATANYITSNPRPVDGRVTLLAYALGEKSFLDVNGDNVFTAGEPFQDLGDVFLDRLYNFDASTQTGYNSIQDQFISLGFSGSQACLPASSPLLALDVTIPSRPMTCTQAFGDGKAYVRSAIQFVLSSSYSDPVWGTSMPTGTFKAMTSCPASRELLVNYQSDDTPVTAKFLRIVGSAIATKSKRGTITVFISDDNEKAFNPMPAKTVVTGDGSAGLSVRAISEAPMPSSSVPLSRSFIYEFDPITTTGTVFVKTKTPRGIEVAKGFTLNLLDAASFDALTEITCP